MTTEVFALCDAATVSGGKLNLLGAFDSIHAAQTPAVHAQCAIAARLRFLRIEEGQHRIKLNVVNEDGHPIMPSIDGVLTVNFGQEDESAVTNFIVNIHQLKFESLGQYSIDLAVDGRHETSLPLFVKAMPAPSPIPPAEL
jgi:Family of unknown function (DUF6941)